MLNPISLNKRFWHKTALAFITCALLFFYASCGKRKAPLPPIERIQQRIEISGYQTGDKVNLKWQMPARNAQLGNTQNISRIDLYRLIEPVDSQLSLSEDDFSARSTLISTIPVAENDFGLKEMSFTDQLEFAGQPSRLRYAVRFVNFSGQKAAFSNFLLITPISRIANPPTNVIAELTQDEIQLRWTEPLSNIDGSSPANVFGYNVYRIADNESSPKLLNSAPITKTFYADKFFNFKQNYTYYIRTISFAADSEPIESLDSEKISILPIDKFSPSPPTAITLAASPGIISIFFASNLESDIEGYMIYRSKEKTLPTSQWQLLTTEPLKTNTFQDRNVQSGSTYYYFLKAVDKAGNVSESSEIVSEKAF